MVPGEVPAAVVVVDRAEVASRAAVVVSRAVVGVDLVEVHGAAAASLAAAVVSRVVVGVDLGVVLADGTRPRSCLLSAFGGIGSFCRNLAICLSVHPNTAGCFSGSSCRTYPV